MNIALPSHIQTWIDRGIEAGRFATEEQVIVEALERMADDRRIPPDLLDEILDEAIAEADRGEVFEWTDELRAEINREASLNVARGLEVPDDVKY